MKNKTIKILGINISIDSKEYILKYILEYLGETRNKKSKIKNTSLEPLAVLTPNPEIIMYAQKHEWYKEIVNTAQINIPDGAGVEWAIGKQYGLHVPKIPGIELMENLVKIASKRGYRIGLIGGKPGLAVDTLECLRKRFTGLEGFSLSGGEFRVVGDTLEVMSENGNWADITGYIEELAQTIKKEKTDILFVGLGFPKQELLIQSLKNYLRQAHYYRPLFIMAVGGSFDMVTGRVPRAPAFMRNLGLEWLFRLVVEPWRMKRMIVGSKFFWKVLLEGSTHAAYSRTHVKGDTFTSTCRENNLF